MGGVQPVAGGAEGAADVGDALHQAVLGDGDVAPDGVEDLGLRDGVAGARGEQAQDVGGLAAELGHGAVGGGHAALGEVEGGAAGAQEPAGRGFRGNFGGILGTAAGVRG